MALFFKKLSGVLGMNARNLDYVTKYNPKASKKFADNKLYTKNFLSSRGLGAAKLFHTIHSLKELDSLKPEMLPDRFVIKPNHGYGGEGIMVIAKRKNDKFISASKRVISWEDLFIHCNSILEGRYAISGTHDQVIIEELLETDNYLAKYSAGGLPDVRVIVFNMIPVIAMLRLPTNESEGKANLHLGAIGLGIDIGTGKTTYGVQNDKFIRKLPNGDKANNLEIPNWDTILDMASKAQQISKIGFLAVDLAVTKSGIKILELNARAGLAVQIANKAPLRNRLAKVEDLKVMSPEQGVSIGKTLFSTQGHKKTEETNTRPVIGLYETVLVLGGKNKHELAKIDPHGKESSIDKSLIDEKSSTTDLTIQDKRITLPFNIADFNEKKYKLIIAGKHLKDFLIDPNKSTATKSFHIAHPDEKILLNIDKKVCDIDEKIKLLSNLKPLNLEEEKAKFIENPNFSPQFDYKIPSIDFDYLDKELKKIPLRISHPLIPIYKKKIKEIKYKLDLIQSIDKEDFGHFSSKLYGSVSQSLYKKAIKFVKSSKIEEDTSPVIPFKESVEIIKKALRKRKLSHWKIKILPDAVAAMQVNKSNTVFIKDKSEFTQNRLQALIAHEIETHIYRLENGRLQPYRILERGTAGYLTIEEGLAVYNQNQLGVALGEKKIWSAISVIAAHIGARSSFYELFHILKEEYGLDSQRAWHVSLKTKRGLRDTSQKIAFTKDIVYFIGNMQVEEYLSKNYLSSIEDLYIGKITIKDLDILKDLHEWKLKYKIKKK